MGIIKCPDCKAEVSTFAAQCIGCGRRFASVLGLIAKGLFLAFNILMAMWLLFELEYGLPRRVMETWAFGAVILGMLALVARDRWSERRMAHRVRRQEAGAAKSSSTEEASEMADGADQGAEKTAKQTARKEVWQRLRG